MDRLAVTGEITAYFNDPDLYEAYQLGIQSLLTVEEFLALFPDAEITGGENVQFADDVLVLPELTSPRRSLREDIEATLALRAEISLGSATAYLLDVDIDDGDQDTRL